MNEDRWWSGGGENRVVPERYIPVCDALDFAMTPLLLGSTSRRFLSRLYTTELCLYGYHIFPLVAWSFKYWRRAIVYYTYELFIRRRFYSSR